MRALDIPIITTVVIVMAVSGVYLGAAPGPLLPRTGTDGASSAPTSRTAELLPVSIPIYQDAERVGFCQISARASLPVNFSDNEYQVAAARTNDLLIKALSSIAPGDNPRRACLSHRDKQVGPSVITDAQYFLAVPSQTPGR
ncbi:MULTISPECIES: hypothetical protein [unclassified Roseitalea]|uniref:hypothetical protein n=1 Tax=unclassified Roseitalea TaxID=2639107 RepID=UPI00273EB9F7|nr:MULTISPECIES: hypothetical protein [unclassified Roseitalea]